MLANRMADAAYVLDGCCDIAKAFAVACIGLQHDASRADAQPSAENHKLKVAFFGAAHKAAAL